MVELEDGHSAIACRMSSHPLEECGHVAVGYGYVINHAADVENVDVVTLRDGGDFLAIEGHETSIAVRLIGAFDERGGGAGIKMRLLADQPIVLARPLAVAGAVIVLGDGQEIHSLGFRLGIGLGRSSATVTVGGVGMQRPEENGLRGS